MTKRQIYKMFAVQQKYETGPFLFDGTLDDVIGSLVAIRDSIPPDFRKNAICEIGSVSSYEDSHYATIEIGSWRDEADEEEALREASEKKLREANELARAAMVEATERAEFARLSAKFGQT